MSKEYKTIKRKPTIAEYKNLCNAVGWTEFINFDVAEESLDQSLFGVVIQHEDEVIGMGRVVGDGKIYFYIQDIAVMPEYQNKGIGKTIMEAILEYLIGNAPEKSFVGLFASKGKESFYKKYGFNKHDGMTGMFGVVHRREIK
ncbi:GNAT family N-acetyltransferase [Cohnella sp. CFH 77786]|uniref:GNAT family N-acetyltransferase n=1 Tax=Cohnella sp. CFH 77786 TaxID=2662265 RepID=UPI001C60C630|nr:GNAT family N-acetyltransferase [Cohnella sp. CFH 77786]MBW5448096.1 GNAT family N-acetyltransferase [Cohnella sp. CFH 77786]